jgi:acetyl esterase/lipase
MSDTSPTPLEMASATEPSAPTILERARQLPAPAYLSQAAAATLSPSVLGAGRQYPALDDTRAWKTMIAGMDAFISELAAKTNPHAAGTVRELNTQGVRLFVAEPSNSAHNERGIILDFHGGGLIAGGGDRCRQAAQVIAERFQSRVWSVDYRMPPDHPYPAGLDDSVGAYRALLKERQPGEIIMLGSSAGGNLAAATLLRARDEGLPLPAGAVFLSPEVDLTESGDSFQVNLGVDPVLGLLMPVNLLYADGHDLKDPYLSPLFGDFTAGFPPSIIASGTRDLFLSNAVRLHRALRAADIAAELHILDAAGHRSFPATSPEGAELDREIRRFILGIWQGE